MIMCEITETHHKNPLFCFYLYIQNIHLLKRFTSLDTSTIMKRKHTCVKRIWLKFKHSLFVSLTPPPKKKTIVHASSSTDKYKRSYTRVHSHHTQYFSTECQSRELQYCSVFDIANPPQIISLAFWLPAITPFYLGYQEQGQIAHMVLDHFLLK